MRRVRSLSLIAATLSTVLVLSAAACGQRAVPSTQAPPPGQGGAQCTLSRSGHAKLDEWGSCVQVTATLSRAPRVDEEAVLTAEVLAVSDRSVRVELDLPAGFAWVVVPAGLERMAVPDPAPENGGCLHRASGPLVVRAGQTARVSGTVKATAPGFATLRARAFDPAVPDSFQDTGADNVFVTVRRRPQVSVFGYWPGNDAGTVAADSPAPVRPCVP